MNDLNVEELSLIQIIRDLKPFETIEIKRDDKGSLIYVYTRKDRYIFLTNKLPS